MANLCDFTMLVKGNRENIDKFYKALTQSSSECWMGRGADTEIKYDDSENEAYIDGYCKWSIQSALIDNARSMEYQRTTGEGIWYWEDAIKDVKKFRTLFECCKEYNVNMEVFSWESGCCFSEHYKYENGNIIDECCDYEERWDDDEEECEYIGGFKADFDLADVA